MFWNILNMYKLASSFSLYQVSCCSSCSPRFNLFYSW